MQRIANLVFRKILKNAPTLAIVAVDTEENEPVKIWHDLFSYSVHSLGEAQLMDVAGPRPQSRTVVEVPEVITCIGL